MNHCDFAWTDLSTFDTGAARAFYAALFGWRFDEQDGYHYAQVGSRKSAGVFAMPRKFQEMGLPSFWMSYISVTDIDQVVERAKEQGAIVEVQPTTFMDQGRIALIRDPAGAGLHGVGRAHPGRQGQPWHARQDGLERTGCLRWPRG